MPGISIPPVFCSVSLLFSLAAQAELAGVHWIPSTGRHCTLGHQCPAARRGILGKLGSFRFLSITSRTMFMIWKHNCLMSLCTADLTTCIRDEVMLYPDLFAHCALLLHGALSGQSRQSVSASERDLTHVIWPE